MSGERAPLSVVPKADRYFLFSEFWEGSYAGSPADCVMDLMLNPEAWPENVNFWLELTFGTARLPALGVCENSDQRKRPTWYPVRLIRLNRDCFRTGELVARVADFWFVAHFAKAISAMGMMVLHVDRDRSFPVKDLFPLPVDDWVERKLVRQKRTWSRDVHSNGYEFPDFYRSVGCVSPWEKNLS